MMWHGPMSKPGFASHYKPIFVQKCFQSISSWWLNQPLWKICSSNWIICPKNRDEHKQIFENTTTQHMVPLPTNPTMDGRIVPGSVPSFQLLPSQHAVSSLPGSAASTTVSAGISSNTSGFFTSFSLETTLGGCGGPLAGGGGCWNDGILQMMQLLVLLITTVDGRRYPKHPTNHRLEGHKTM